MPFHLLDLPTDAVAAELGVPSARSAYRRTAPAKPSRTPSDTVLLVGYRGGGHPPAVEFTPEHLEAAAARVGGGLPA